MPARWVLQEDFDSSRLDDRATVKQVAGRAGRVNAAELRVFVRAVGLIGLYELGGNSSMERSFSLRPSHVAGVRTDFKVAREMEFQNVRSANIGLDDVVIGYFHPSPCLLVG